MLKFIRSEDEAKQTLAAAERSLAAAQERLAQAGDRVEKARADIEVKLATGARDKARRDLKAVEVVAEQADLDARGDALAETLLRDWSGPAETIVGLMSTSVRLKEIMENAGRRGLRVPRLLLPLCSMQFCAELRLPRIGPEGLDGHMWYPAAPEQIAKIKAKDAIGLDGITAGAFVGKPDETGHAAVEASGRIIKLYTEAACKLGALLIEQGSLFDAIRSWERKKGHVPRGDLLRLRTRAIELTGDGALSRLANLPAADGGESIWSARAGFGGRLAGEVWRGGANMVIT